MAGRGKVFGDRNAPMRRPGEPLTVSPQSLVQKLAASQFDTLTEIALTKFVEMYEGLAASTDDQNNLIKLMHSTCLTDASFCRKVAKFLAAMERKPGSVSRDFRGGLLTCLQEDFQMKDKLLKTNPEQLLNAALFHGEIYDSLRILDAPVQVLAGPLLEYLKLVLETHSLNAAQLIVLQMAVNGSNLKDQEAISFENFLIEIRKEILQPSISTGKRQRLLLALEVGLGTFTFAEGPSKDYYSEDLGDDFKVLESRMLGIPYHPDPTPKTPVKNADEVSSYCEQMGSVSVSSASQNASVGLIPDAEAVRSRMRAKGLLPRKSLESRLDKDADVYGIQLHRADSKTGSRNEALSAPLPTEDW